MARKPITDMSAWPSLSLEGNLIAPAMGRAGTGPGGLFRSKGPDDPRRNLDGFPRRAVPFRCIRQDR